MTFKHTGSGTAYLVGAGGATQRMNLFRFTTSLAALLLVAGSALAQPLPERQQALRHLLLHDCGSCHGLSLRGGLGPPLRPEDLEGKSANFLAVVIYQGRPGTAMPPWHPFLSEAEARWLADLIKEGIR